MINPKVIKEFLNRKLDNYDWMKKESSRDVTAALDELEPAPDFGKLKLWLHQKVCFLILVYLQRFMLFLDMGGGKTLLSLLLINYRKQRGEKPKAVVFVPYVITTETWVEETEKWTNLNCIALTGTTEENKELVKNADADLFVISYQSAVAMISKKKKLNKKEQKKLKKKIQWTLTAAMVRKFFVDFDMVIMDEIHKCFVKGTKVLTPNGEVPIETLEVGDKVVSSFGTEEVTHTFKHYTNEIVTVIFENGKTLKCTPDHPFLTDEGWLRADKMEGVYAYDYETLPMVQERISSEGQSQEDSKAKVLWHKLFSQMAHVAASYKRINIYERMAFQSKCGTQEVAPDTLWEKTGKAHQQPHETEQSGQEQPCYAKGNRNKTPQRDIVGRKAWGQRDWSNRGTGIYSSLFARLATRISNIIGKERTRLSNLLQSRCGEPTFENSHRVRRSFPHDSKKETTRLQTRYQASRIRVVSVSSKKYRHPVPVFNVEVSNTPHYFAEGILTHNCKNPSSKTYIMCRALCNKCEWAVGLTGTPFGRDLEDLWAQFYLIDFGETLGKTLGFFKEAFFNKKQGYWGGYEYTFKKRLMPTLKNMIKNRSIRYHIDECHDMPPKKSVKKYVDPTDSIASYYDKIVDSLETLHFGQKKFSELESEYHRLRQLSSGFMTFKGSDDSKVEVSFPVNPKLEVVEELIDAMPDDSKMIIFHDYVYTNKLISDHLRKLKVPHARVWGKGKNNIKELRRFKRDKKCRVLIINCQSGSSSQNLQVANYVVYFEQPRSAIDRQQSERRAWRPGQEKRVFLIDILMRNTLDIRARKANKEGKDLLRYMLDRKIKFKRAKRKVVA